MADQPANFELLSVSEADKGKNYLARVSFAFKPSSLLPLPIEQSVEKSDGYRNYTVAEIFGADRVIVKSAFLKRSRKEDLFVQVPYLKLPWSLSKAIAEAAYLQLETGKAVLRD